jgi:RNA polymerase sigma-70 factor (ECF subfamily)
VPFAERAEERVFSGAGGSLADVDSRAWVDGLRATGTEYDDTVAALWSLLLRAARHEANRRASLLGIRGPELDDIAHQAANDDLVAILGKLSDFRGDSRFTTWAYKFVMFEVSTKMGRHFWRTRLPVQAEVDWERLTDRLSLVPEQRVELNELVGELRRAVESDLTERQRTVFVAIAINEVPTDALSHELGCSRNAIYKILFDARRKLRSSLARAGYNLHGDEERP